MNEMDMAQDDHVGPIDHGVRKMSISRQVPNVASKPLLVVHLVKF